MGKFNAKSVSDKQWKAVPIMSQLYRNVALQNSLSLRTNSLVTPQIKQEALI